MVGIAEASALLAGIILGSRPGPPPEILDRLREDKPDLYTTRTIDVSEARDRVEFNVSGSWLYVNKDTATVDVEIRLNEPDKAVFNLSKLKLISLPFYRFFVTHTAGSGSMEIIIGKTGMMISPSEVDIEVTGAEIMLPIDIQGAYIMMPVDIQAQYMTLEIDIVAQTVGNISVDLAAQTIGNIVVDINAQTVGNLTIDIEAQSVGVYLQPEWAALQEDDKNFYATLANSGWGYSVYATYTVPNGSTLYICGFSFSIWATNEVDYIDFLYFRAYIMNYTDTIAYGNIGGIGGGSVTFTKPVVIPENKVFRAYGYNYSGALCDFVINAWGYEL